MSEISPEQAESLLREAREARERAYAPYSGFLVGAAVLADDGRTFPGANVENASYGLGVCAERTAVLWAVSQGVRKLVSLALIGSAEGFTWPCGACRQVLHEFGPDMVVISEDPAGRREQRPLSRLLPDAFGPADLT